MDRALVAVLGGAVGCGALLALAVLKNERTFTTRLFAESPAAHEASPPSRTPDLPRPRVPPSTHLDRPAAPPVTLPPVRARGTVRLAPGAPPPASSSVR